MAMTRETPPATEHPAPLTRELRRLRKAVRLFWVLLTAGLISCALGIHPWAQKAGPIVVGFGLGLVLAAFLLRSSQVQCPRCSAYLNPVRLGTTCLGCGAALK